VAEKRSRQAAPDDVAFAVSFEVKSLRARAFIRRQDPHERCNAGGRLIQGRAPNMNFVAWQSIFATRAMPYCLDTSHWCPVNCLNICP
jgi:hypothetical protein